MNRFLTRGILVLVIVLVQWSMGSGTGVAEASGSRCEIVQSSNVAGLDWSRLNATRRCQHVESIGVSGITYVASGVVTVSFNDNTSSLRQVSKTTTHELTHMLEWRTTPAMRVALYQHLGVQISGRYEDVPTADGNNLEAWKANARERLAESVVACQFGMNSFDGMNLVPMSECGSFMKTVTAALDAVG